MRKGLLTPELIERARPLIQSDPTISQRRLLAALGCNTNNYSLWVALKDAVGAKPAATGAPPSDAVAGKIRQTIGRMRKPGAVSVSVSDVANLCDCSPRMVEDVVAAMQREGLAVELSNGHTIVGAIRPGSGGIITHDIGQYDREWSVIGATGDWHLGSHWERLDVINALYDLYDSEGVQAVYHTGNWIEGECRLNQLDVKVHGMTPQINYFIENTPRKKGITTYFVAGDDHEGWYQKAFGVNIGKVAQDAARAAGRDDLVFLGYVEADVELRTPSGHTRHMRIMHPGGGSAYAHSYAPQKIVESFQGGEKPQVLLIGHYHKFEYCYPREVHVVQTGCCVDQSIFMRKQKIQAMVGGCLIWINQADDGIINRFRAEWMPFYDRDFYRNRRQFNAAMGDIR